MCEDTGMAMGQATTCRCNEMTVNQGTDMRKYIPGPFVRRRNSQLPSIHQWHTLHRMPHAVAPLRTAVVPTGSNCRALRCFCNWRYGILEISFHPMISIPAESFTTTGTSDDDAAADDWAVLVTRKVMWLRWVAGTRARKDEVEARMRSLCLQCWECRDGREINISVLYVS
jgi:hypothetical protein